MASYSFVQCDVFTDRPFEGNPLAVFLDGRGLDDATMQRIAREMNLSETVFVFPPADPSVALRRLRIFTPARELPMAGHPVVGTWSMLARRGVVQPPRSGSGQVTFHQELRAGVLPVTVEFEAGVPTRVVMAQPQATIGPALALAPQTALALGLEAADLDEAKVPLLVASTAVPFLMVPVRNRDVLRRVRVQSAALSHLLAASDAQGVYAYVASPPSARAQISARMLADATLGITEDPATGIAAGPLAATLVHYGVIPAPGGSARFIIEQGVDMGRPSYIHAEVDGAVGAVKAIRIAGTAVEVLRGEVEW